MPDAHGIRRIATAGLCSIALIALGLCAWILGTGGDNISIAGLRVSVRNAARPFFLAGVAATMLVACSPVWRSRIDRLANRLAALPSSVVLGAVAVLAGGVLLIGVRYGSFLATAADSYGYLTQAELWIRSVPRIEQSLPQSFPWPDAQFTFAPLGYRPSIDARAIVPTYPPGYPLLMAAALLLFGQGAQYFVVPVMAALTVIAVFLLGRQIAGAWVGATAALLLSASPVFLFQTCLPMSDVPAAAASTIALLLIVRPTIGSAVGAGIVAGAAFLIRPNLAPVVALLAVLDPISAVFTRRPDDGASDERRMRVRRSIGRATVFIGAALPAVIALAALNRRWYGSSFASGYGDLGPGFSLRHWPINLRHYSYWLWETQTAAIFLAPLALWTSAASDVRASRARLVLFACAVAACYAFYLPFDNWQYLRFLLPAYPALLILLAAVTVDIAGRFPRPIGAVAALALIGTVTLSGLREAQVKGVFGNWLSVRRFVDVPAYARASLPPNAIYLTRVYSGSLRYYADRPTIRWDVLDPTWLDKAVVHLRTQGLLPLIVVEDGGEEHDYRERFRGAAFGALDWPPIAVYRSIETVRIFNPADGGRKDSTQTHPSNVPDRIPISTENRTGR